MYEDLPLGLRILRDLLGPDIERVRVDSAALCQRMQGFAETFVPELAAKIRAAMSSCGCATIAALHEEARLVASDPGPYRLFGIDVAIDGGRALVASSPMPSTPLAGDAYFFHRSAEGGKNSQSGSVHLSDIF